MNAFFFLLVAILGSHAEGVKVRAIRRRLIEYPYEPPSQIVPAPQQSEYTQRVPINEDPRIFTYLDRNGVRYMYGPAYGGNVNLNRRVLANAPNILWAKAAGPDLIRFDESRPGQTKYNVDQNSRDGKERINYSEDQTETNSGYKETSLNPSERRFVNEDQTNNSQGENKRNTTHSNQSKGNQRLSESEESDSASVTDRIEIGTDENLMDKVSGNDEQDNYRVSHLSVPPTVPGSENDVDTVDQSKLNVENVEEKPIRYVANKQYLLAPLNRRLYPVDEIKTDWENETSQINIENFNNTKEDNSGLIRLVPEREFISVTGGGRYSKDQSESSRISLKNTVNVLDVTNNRNIAPVRFQSEDDLVSPDNKNTYLVGLNNPDTENVDQVEVAKGENNSPNRFALDNDRIYLVGENRLKLDKNTPRKSILQVIKIAANPKHLTSIRLEPEGDATSTNAETKYSINRELDANSLNRNYTYEKDEKHRLPIYLYRFGQNTYLYQPTDQNIPWKQLDISKLIQSAIARRVGHAEPNAEKNSDNCLACETLLKVLSENPNLITQYSLLGDGNIKNIPADGIPWNYLEIEGKKEPISLQYYQPSTIITKTGNENTRRMDTEKKLVDIYGYNKFEYPQTFPFQLTGKIIPKLQVNPQYESMEDKKNLLLTLIAGEPNVRLDETHVDASKPNGETLQTQYVPVSKEDSDDVTKRTPKTPDSPVIYLTSILKTPNEVTLPVSEQILTQNVPIQSAVHKLQNNDATEMLLNLKAPETSKIPTSTVLDSEEQSMPWSVPSTLSANSPVAAWDAVPEEEEEEHIPNAYTSTPTPWNLVPEQLLPSTPADAIDVSKTYVQYPAPQNGISQKLLPSDTLDASKMPISYTSSPHVPKSRHDNLPSTEALNASKKSTTDAPETRRSGHNFVEPTNYVQFATDQKYVNPRPKAPTTKTPEKITDADDVTIAYAPLETDRNTIPRQLLPFQAFDVTEIPTTNSLLEETTHVLRANDKKYENTIPKEMLPSNVPDTNDVLKTQNPIEKDWSYYDLSNELLNTEPPNTSKTPSTAIEKDGSYYDLSNELLNSEAPNTSETPSTPTPTTRKWKTTPEKTLPSKDSYFSNSIPQHSPPTETPDASKSPTKSTPSTSTEEIFSSKEADMTDKSAATKRTTPGELRSSKTSGTSETPAQSTTETNHWSNLPEDMLPSTESVSSELLAAYTLSPILTDWTPREEESVPSKTSDEFEIPVRVIYDSDTTEQSPTSPQTDPSEISTANNNIATDWVTVTEEPVNAVEPDALNIPTTEIPNDWMATRNGDPKEIRFSKDLDTSEIATARKPDQAHWIRIAEESMPSVESNMFKIPTSKISNDWNKPENILFSGDLDTSKVPAVHTSVPTDWISITGDSIPSIKTSLPEYLNKPKQLLFSEKPSTFEVPSAYTSIPTGWTAITDKLRTSQKPNAFTIPRTDERDNWYYTPERWRSQHFNAEYDQSMLLNFEGTTPEEQYFIRQVMNVLMPDLLRLYYSRCYKEVNRELLKRLKVAIDSVRESNCDTSSEYN